LDTGVSSRERTFPAARRVRRQRDGPVQERRVGGGAAPSVRAGCRALKLGGDALVRFFCRQRSVPRAAVRVGIRIAHLCQRLMRPLSAPGCRRAIDRRAHQRMAEADARPDV
jgi:hypothetical protein